ncbi:RNA polymerase factor sigma-54 [Shouchella clausii]|jgi:RNA polymerase sigma-54 factor|uniref:RNA polymerase sigma-54 factor n=1 Tax=Shouchella clausii TaxID=79880 RepID=A0A268RXX0_SHOCL|nr:RNA polymerase factor sigma-54 [Shouchella clausii]PAD41983.1 RNA polymerase sigma-54 factor [Bacillus sp. 7520-S]MBU8598304.1 RNA polymerase factor sigma-54 [Shouchella clausii]MCY1105170.1 RNA polymerase factor sigma-54 [Shouchella clausii]MEB5481849.1 RNA polymerase factor sigma-54 [Shouchella clausii]MED4158493.1 RNA polymerase factor sigma-54 [Shouchella clausii]
MEIGLLQRQTTSLVMTQELRQALHLLQYSSVDVIAYLREQALENPLLELHERSTLSRERELDGTRPIRQTVSSDDKQAALQNVPQRGRTLADELHEQLIESPTLSENDKCELTYLIGNLREDGYLGEELPQLCADRKIAESEGERLLAILQSFEPAGVGARSLGECLALQLKRMPDCHPLAIDIVLNHLEALAARKWKQLAKQYGVAVQDIQQLYDQLKELDPKPGLRYSKETAIYVQPDVLMAKDESGKLLVFMNDDILPAIRVHEEYDHLLKQQVETSAYAKQKKQHVEWLKRSLEQRQQTVRRVAEVLASEQADYLLQPNGVLKPLTLNDVAQVLGIHESTVSRATANKYAQTPRGLVELKGLFSAHVSKSDTQLTNHHVKVWLKEMISVEDKSKPLSDQKLAEQLRIEKGVALSRRVVAKYRDELGILPSSKRKRYNERTG